MEIDPQAGSARTDFLDTRRKQRHARRRRATLISALIATVSMAAATWYIAGHYRIVYDKTAGTIKVLTVEEVRALQQKGAAPSR